MSPSTRSSGLGCSPPFSRSTRLAVGVAMSDCQPQKALARLCQRPLAAKRKRAGWHVSPESRAGLADDPLGHYPLISANIHVSLPRVLGR